MTAMMSVTPTISVIIATRDRAESLREVLTDLAAQATEGQFTYEVLVADNESTDGTKALVERLAATFPVPLVYLFEGRRGKAFALNMAIAKAQGEWIALTDDDVRIGPTWLSTIHQTAHAFHADGVGGPTKPLWVGDRPHWLSDRLVRQLGIVDYGPNPFRVMDARTLFIGPNAAYRKILFTRHGGFDEERNHASQDVEWFLRVLRAGYTMIYQPQAALYHKVDARRWTPRTLAHRFFQHGRGSSLGLQEQGTARTLCRVPLWVVRYWLTLHWEAAACWLRGEQDEALWHWLRRYFYLGAMWYCFEDWAQRRPMRRARPAIVAEPVSPKLTSSARS